MSDPSAAVSKTPTRMTTVDQTLAIWPVLVKRATNAVSGI
jgi:hypothetical protein